ncbi:5-oxoprolinase subunit PxpB [Maribacter sp. TH_r10]|uniref:5-oxoprolinase subunit PxpB n=1 Tax=Maribacter sp. TH_r10 TaxID=3082086 RepID=UPI002953CC36|nr:5-oxoprolinase subunit PxpB [Maribacter sp. TH_r10]MDV7139010.1 5-oxoprolinase subunit PxpB [Maribacter sp. TH_r10]
MKDYKISIRSFGEHAVLVEWPNEVDEAILEDIIQFKSYLKKNRLDQEEWEMVPAYNSLTLIDKNRIIDYQGFKKELKTWYKDRETVKKRDVFLWRLPVCYDSDFAIDIEDVAKKLGITVENVIALHTSSIFTVYGIGFLPGFMYLGGLPKELEVPRRSEPRQKVDKGSVGLAGKQTGIYPQESPGGWNIIGNCSVPIFDAEREEPCFVNVGDKIQFYPISRAEYDLHKIQGEVGIYQFEKVKLDA